jgi:hypothetical protein
MDLYGVNFLHHGAPKTWYCVPPQYGYKLEKIAAELFPSMAQVQSFYSFSDKICLFLKGKCHEIFDPRFFSSNNPNVWLPQSNAV